MLPTKEQYTSDFKIFIQELYHFRKKRPDLSLSRCLDVLLKERAEHPRKHLEKRD